jgi:glycerol uptake facilitator protein
MTFRDISGVSGERRIRETHPFKGEHMDENKTWQKLAAEFLGTAFLVFIGVGSVPATIMVNGDAPFTMDSLATISWAFALIVIVTVYVFGYIGGNHINPAVTVGLAARGFFPWKDVPGYVIAQVLGAVAGSFAIIGVLGQKAIDTGLGIASYGDISIAQAFFAEFLGTFLLVFTVFGVIHRKAAGGWFGLAIGFAVFAIIIVVAPATGASINPARTTGPMIVESLFSPSSVNWSQYPIYIIAELLGGVVGALLHGAIAKTDADAKAA